MPTIFILFGFRFFFYSNGHDPIHVHIKKGGAYTKYAIRPIRLIENNDMKSSDLKMIESIIEENEEVIFDHWNRYFNQTK